MIDAVTKIKLIFIFGEIKLILKNISYFPILQYFNVCFIFINCISCIYIKMRITSPVAYRAVVDKRYAM